MNLYIILFVAIVLPLHMYSKVGQLNATECRWTNESETRAEKKNKSDRNVYSSSTPKLQLRLGNALGPFADGGTSILSLYGDKEYYNSKIWYGPGTFVYIDEPNNSVQIQYRLGDEFGSWQLSFLGFKQKFHNAGVNKFGYEAPVGLHLGIGKNYFIYGKGRFGISGNTAFGIGPETGLPRFDDRTVQINYRKPKIDRYYWIGYGASLISRVDVTYKLCYSLFVAGIYHHSKTLDLETSIGTQKGETIGSLALNLGLGINFGLE